MARLSGVIERIVFRNEETHYTVARLRPNDDGRLFRSELVTLVGALPGVSVGELVEVEGEWETHPQHGRHLRVATCTPHAPVTPEGLKQYLGSGVIKGMGPKTAERIVNRFGEQTLAIIELEPERLTEAQGVSASMRERIIAGWAEQREIRDLMLFLQSHEVSPGLAVKIYRQYGKESLATIRENPYTLERDIHGVGFRTADALAVKLGLPRDALPRLMTGIKHALSEAASRGRALLPAARGTADARGGAAGDADRGAGPGAGAAAAEKEVFVEEERVYLAPFFYAENGTARRLRLILKAPSQLPAVSDEAWEASFAELERAQGITLAESQRAGGAAGVYGEGLRPHRRAGRRQDDGATRAAQRAGGQQRALLPGGADRTRGQAHDRGDGPPGQHAAPPAGVHPGEQRLRLQRASPAALPVRHRGRGLDARHPAGVPARARGGGRRRTCCWWATRTSCPRSGRAASCATSWPASAFPRRT